MTKPTLQAIHCFPIKGFAGYALPHADLEIGNGIPNDRRYAITTATQINGERVEPYDCIRGSVFDGLLSFQIYAVGDHGIELSNPGGESISLEFENAASVSQANMAIGNFIETITPVPNLSPKLVEVNGSVRNWDFSDTPISLINPASVREIADALGMSNDPMRFRGNLLIDGLKPWEEFSWVGQRLQIGEAEIEISRPIARCPAPGVNTKNGKRDIDFQQKMPEAFGHAYCGLYGKIVKAGHVQADDEIAVIGNAEMTLESATASAEPYPVWARFVDIIGRTKDESRTLYQLAAGSAWPLAPAKIGQRLRICMCPTEWTSAYIVDASEDHYVIEVEKSQTDDPVTEKLRTFYDKGDRLITCGPFGRG